MSLTANLLSSQFANVLTTALAEGGVTGFDSLLAYETCGSTMEEAAKFFSDLKHGDRMSGLIVVAQQQSAGRGREGRPFLSKRGSGIWATFGFCCPTGLELQGLSLAMGVGMSEALARRGIEVGLKWPNDVVVSSSSQPLAKLAGVLIESTLRQQGLSNVRIGIGLNLQAAQSKEFISIGLSELCQTQGLVSLTYEEAFVLLAQAVADTWSEFVANGFADFAPRWTRNSIMFEKLVSFTLNGETRLGVVRGLASDGGLIVQPQNEAAITIYGGEVKLLDATSY